MGWQYFPMSQGPCADAPGYVGGWQITSYFGGRVDPITGQQGSHGGQDMAYRGCSGASIYAPDNGTLAQGWDSSGGGNWSGITLDTGEYVGIGHALSFAPGASYRRVSAGELIAFCDSTGGSTGDHVHFAYRPYGSSYYADPYDLLMDCSHRIVGGPPPIPPIPLGEKMQAKIVGGRGSMWMVWYVQDSETGVDIPFSKTWIPDENGVQFWQDFGVPIAGEDDRTIDKVPTTGMVGNTPDAAD